MKIDKSWLYKLSNLTPLPLELKEGSGGWIIDIWDNLAVTLFDDINMSLNINIWENSNVEFFWYFNSPIHCIEYDGQCIDNYVQCTQNIIQSEPWSKLNLRYMIYSDDKINNKITINSEVLSPNCSSDIKILSIAWKDWNIDLDWIIKIWSWISWIKWRLIEENLFLWDSWKIKGIPTLLVESNDVEASHACKIERISDEKLFYLRSRWVWKDNALRMIIEAKILDLFKCLNMIDKPIFEELTEKIIKNIK